MVSVYTFSEYCPKWPEVFFEEAARLRSLLGDQLLGVYHIGSTSVPGLAAKPVIDLLPAVRDIQRIDRYTALLERSGYRTWGEYGLPGRRYLSKDADGIRTHNIHIYQHDNTELVRHLAFCAYLRHHAAVRDEYAVLKRAAYARYPADIEAYNNYKNEWIKKTEKTALEWYRSRAGV